jgi:predicted Zn finger-like uncharacterized protein
MRLICPSCGAQYEVDDSVIPEAGRDVQCSNCGRAWFQVSAAQLKAQAERDAAASDEPQEEAVVWSEDDATAQTGAPHAAEASEEAGRQTQSEETPEAPEDTAATPAPDTAADAGNVAEPEWKSRRKSLDDSVVNVLREEADRERRVREAEGSTVDAQAPLAAAAVTVVAPVVAAAQDDVPESPEEFTDDGDEAVVSRASRRELLPDIEEINSTLRATSDRGGEAASIDAPATLRRRRSGFRMGFSTSILIAALLLLLYVMAPTIAEKVPATASMMGSYVAAVDGMREWLDSTLRGLTASMKDDGG